MLWLARKFADRFLLRKLDELTGMLRRLDGERSYYAAAAYNAGTAKMDQLVAYGQAESILGTDGGVLRRRLRALLRNNPNFAGLVGYICGKVLGANGILPQVKTDNEALNDEIETLFRREMCARKCDIRGIRNWRGWQASLLSERLTVGDGYGYWSEHRGRFVLEVFEVEDLCAMIGVGGDGRAVMDGIEYDDFGAVTAYHVQMARPGALDVLLDVQVIPAERVAHLFNAERPSQIRGVSEFVQAAVTMHDCDDADVAELTAIRASAYYGLHFQKDANTKTTAGMPGGLPTSLNSSATSTTSANALKVDMKPGMVHEWPGTVSLLDAKRPGGQYLPFVSWLMKKVAARLRVPYHVATADTTQANYSSARCASLPERDRFREDQAAIIMESRNAFRAWLTHAVLRGEVRLRRYTIDEIVDLTEWQKPGFEWIDISAEAEATKTDLATGRKTWSQMVSEAGKDPRDQIKAIKADMELAKQFGIAIPVCGVPAVDVVAGKNVKGSNTAAKEDLKPANEIAEEAV